MGKNTTIEWCDQLSRDREKAQEDGNNVEAQHCQEELLAIEDRILKAHGIYGKDRDLNNHFDKLRTKIWGTLNTAYQKLRNADPPMNELAAHFEGSISSEVGKFVYQPAMVPLPNWKTDS